MLSALLNKTLPSFRLVFCMKEEGNVLFNDALNTFPYGYVVKGHSDSERGNPQPPLHGLLFSISSMGPAPCKTVYILTGPTTETTLDIT